MAFKKRALFCSFIILALLVPMVANSAPWDKSVRIYKVTKKYQKGKIITVTGTVEKIYKKIPGFGKKHHNALGFHMRLKTAREMFDVHLGPVWYLDSVIGKLAVGDVVEVKGAESKGHLSASGKRGLNEIRAAEIRKGNQVVLRLRDKAGLPLWSGFAN